MIIGYVVVQTGYEGIDEVIGLFDKDAAVARMKELRKAKKSVGPFRRSIDPDFFCVMRVDSKGAKCACKELDVKPSKPMLR